MHSMAQQMRIEGKVVNDSTGLSVSGASIYIIGGATTQSRGDGSFILTTNIAQPVLIITASGFKPDTLSITNKSSGLLIQLKPVHVLLKEVTINTGYQQLSPEKTTGSFETINSRLLNRSVSNNILSRLEGVASGFYVDNSKDKAGFFIRGLSTLRAETQPLIILDNFPYDGDINNIDPDNIETITVLRDAGAASIWGAKAANGILVITSKKGKYGQGKNVSFAVNYTLGKKPDILKSNDFMSSADFMGVEKFLFEKGYYNADLSNQFSYPVVSPLVEMLALERSGSITAQQVSDSMTLWAKQDVRHDYLRYLYQPMLMQQYSTALSGGSSAMNYMFSLNYDKTRTNIVGNEGYRGNINIRLGFKPTAKLELQTAMQYTIGSDDFNGFSSIQASAFKARIYPYARLADDAGNPIAVIKQYRSAYVDTAGAGVLLDWKYRPLEEQRLADNNFYRRDLQASLGFKYTFNNQLSAELKAQWQQSSNENRYHYSVATFYARDLINRFTNRAAGNTIVRNIPVGGVLDAQDIRFVSGALRGQINYNSSLTKDLELSALAGFEAREVRENGESERTYGWDANRLTYANVDPTRFYNLWENLGGDVIISGKSFTNTTNRFVSWFGNAAWNYRKKYLLSGSVRKDASNLFGVNTNQKWNPFWSVGGAWKLSREKFYRFNTLPELSIRVTYGFSGNIIPGQSALPILSYSENSVIPVPYAAVNNAPNPSLRWEQTGTLNLAADFVMKGERLSGTIEYYKKHSSDLFTPMPLDPTLGIRSQVLNAASLISRGVNIKLSATPIKKKVQWQVDFLLDHVTNKVTKFFNENVNKGAYIGYGTGITPLQGKDPYALISYKWAGLDPQTGDPLGYVNDTLSRDYAALVRPTSFDDMVIKGSTRPKWYGSLRNGFSYREFTISCNIRYAFAYYFRRRGMSYSAMFSQWNMSAEYAERWQKPGDEKHTNVPSLVYPFDSRRDDFYFYSEATVEKGDHVRLQDILLQYRLSGLRSKMSFIRNAELSLYLNNLGIIWRANNKKLDPAFGLNVPTPLNISLGLRTNF